MKNLLNYLDDYFEENIEEKLCNRKFNGKISKEQANEWQCKANRKTLREEEIDEHGKQMSYNKHSAIKTKHSIKDKHKNQRF